MSRYYNDELYHFGVKGMRWGVRKDRQYRSSGIRSYVAKKSNEKVDASFKKWKTNAKRKEDAVSLGKIRNEKRMQYETNKTKENKKAYSEANKAYKKAFRQNTTYRKGNIKNEVGKDLSRKYLSEAKKQKKVLDSDPSNKIAKKQYAKLMSKHDVVRAQARRAPMVYARKAQRQASFKRGLTIARRTAITSATATAGAYAVNKYLRSSGKSISVSPENMVVAINAVQKIMRNI